jgi:hypothetical protein
MKNPLYFFLKRIKEDHIHIHQTPPKTSQNLQFPRLNGRENIFDR